MFDEEVADNRSLLDNNQKDTPLERLFNYYIKETDGNAIPFGKWEKFSLFMEIFGASGGIYAWPPAWGYAKNKSPWLAYSLVITNPLSNVLFLGKATDDMFDAIKLESTAPREIRDLLDLQSKKQTALRYSKMTFGSAFCAIPFGLATYMFPLPGVTSDLAIALIVTHSTVANMILHAISWNFILTPEMWYYRLPIIPFEKAIKAIRRRCMSEEKAQILADTKTAIEIYDKYKQHFSQLIEKGVEVVINNYLHEKDNYDQTYLARLLSEESSFQLFASLVAKDLKLGTDQNRKNLFKRTFTLIDKAMSNGIVGFLGGLFVVIGCSGWVANPFYIGIQKQLNLPESIALGALPSYSTAVLCAFYGAAIFNQIYNYLTTWSGGIKNKFPFEARMYPATFTAFLVINTYIAAFAYGAAIALIDAVFADEMWDDVRPALISIGIPAMILLSFVPLMGLFSSFTRKAIGKFGDVKRDNVKAERLLATSSIMIKRIQQLNGRKLMEGLSLYSDDELESLGISSDSFHEDQQKIGEIHLSSYSFFGGRSKDARDIPTHQHSTLNLN